MLAYRGNDINPARRTNVQMKEKQIVAELTKIIEVYNYSSTVSEFYNRKTFEIFDVVLKDDTDT